MKLKTNDGKELDVNFWSFFWAYVMVMITFKVVVVGSLLLLGLLLNFIGA